jgi:hypothetical protein
MAQRLRRIAQEERQRAGQLAGHIGQLGTRRNARPAAAMDTPTSQKSVHTGQRSILELITEDVHAKQISLQTRKLMIAYLGGNESPHSRELRQELAMEQRHAEVLHDLLEELWDADATATPTRAGGSPDVNNSPN